MLVSVLINNYNYADYLDYCIKSVLNQTYPDIEIILYDDGSSDHSLDVARKYSDRIKILSFPNFGKYPSFNQANAIYQAFKVASGDIICLLDSDDAYLPRKVEKVVKRFKLDGELVLVQHKMLEIDNDGHSLNNVRRDLIIDSNILKIILFTQRLNFFFMQTSSLSFKRDYLENILPIQEDDNHHIWPDVRLTRNALFYGKIYTINEPLGEYRIHGRNDSGNLKSKEFFEQFNSQQYDYFNSLSTNRGLPTIHYSRSLVTFFRILFANFISDSTLENKICFAKSFLHNALKKVLP
jgi:glycosyltransferase involved in cell wall biosynthesis